MPRRLAITGPHRLEILDYVDAPLAPHQIRVRTQFASGKHGTNLGMFDGRSFAGQVFDQEMRLFLDSDPTSAPDVAAPAQPRNSGTTGVGVVEEIGAEVTRWQVGDRVFGPMDIRETNVCPADRVWALGSVDVATALCIEPAYVAFHAVREANVRFGDTVAVIGLGVLGLLAVRMAALSGAAQVIGVDGLANRRDLARACGAQLVLDPGAGDAAAAIHKRLGGPGVDVAIELAGVYPALQTAIRAARVGGTVCAAGFYQGDAQGLWLGREWHHNRLTMIVPHGCGWGHPPRLSPLGRSGGAYATLAAMMQQGQFDIPNLISPWVAFDQATTIFETIARTPDQTVKFGVRFPQRAD